MMKDDCRNTGLGFHHKTFCQLNANLFGPQQIKKYFLMRNVGNSNFPVPIYFLKMF